MADQKTDFLRDYQTLAQRSWETWARQFQPAAPNPFVPQPASGNEAMERTLSGLKSYFDWLQSVAGGQLQAPPVAAPWQAGITQPFAQAFGSIEGTGAEGFMRQWQGWMDALQRGGFGQSPVAGVTPAFGLNREQQMQQEALLQALQAALAANARYQAQIQRAGFDGMARLQKKLAEPGLVVETPQALYALWVDASEDAWAEVALAPEFRAAYGEMVNTQMRVRQLQQQQTEQFCRELGMPTRREVSSLGERVQALRREVRTASGGTQAGELLALRREVTALRRRLEAFEAAAAEPAPAAARRAATPGSARGAASKPAGQAMKAAKAAKAVKTITKTARAKRAGR